MVYLVVVATSISPLQSENAFVGLANHENPQLKGSVHEAVKSTALVLPPTTELCSTLRTCICLIYADAGIFVLSGEKETVVYLKST